MNLRLLTLFALLANSFTSYAMNEKDILIKMPAADILGARLKEMRLMHLVNLIEHTDLIKQLANQEMYPQDVAMALDKSLYDSNNYMRKNHPSLRQTSARIMQGYKPKILNALLKDHPEALEELEQDGIYTPSSNQD